MSLKEAEPRFMVLNSQEIVKQSGSNFVRSFSFLSKEKQDALNHIYAFCRLTDDLVDGLEDNGDSGRVHVKVDQWQALTAKALKGETVHPVLTELAKVVKRYKIPHDYLFELIQGMRMDLDQKTYDTFEELYPYCYRVAGVVGLMAMEVFGYLDPRHKDYAVQLGVAFQLTNIIRDLKSDALRGRIYLPQEDLRRFGLTPEQFLYGPSAHARAFMDLILYEAQRAEQYYRSAQAAIVPRERRNILAADIMCSVYHAILRKIVREPLSVFKGKVSLSKCEKIMRLGQGFVYNRFNLAL